MYEAGDPPSSDDAIRAGAAAATGAEAVMAASSTATTSATGLNEPHRDTSGSPQQSTQGPGQRPRPDRFADPTEAALANR
jgi:hypothetical protein